MKSSSSRRAKFRFSADEPGSTFECRLDKRPFKPCLSPFKRTVAPGRHNFRVRSTDAAGNRDSTAAKFVWTVTSSGATIVREFRPASGRMCRSARLPGRSAGGPALRRAGRHGVECTQIGTLHAGGRDQRRLGE